MSHTLNLELSDQVFTAIQQQAEVMGIPPEQLATALLEQRFRQVFKMLQSDADKKIARSKFEHHFGALSLEQGTDVGNESIDTDLAREYASTHEVD